MKTNCSMKPLWFRLIIWTQWFSSSKFSIKVFFPLQNCTEGFFSFKNCNQSFFLQIAMKGFSSKISTERFFFKLQWKVFLQTALKGGEQRSGQHGDHSCLVHSQGHQRRGGLPQGWYWYLTILLMIEIIEIMISPERKGEKTFSFNAHILVQALGMARTAEVKRDARIGEILFSSKVDKIHQEITKFVKIWRRGWLLSHTLKEFVLIGRIRYSGHP